ncbi:MAG TPA: PadR family transcriptional regulator [Bacillota bacterium]|nr:PadR family transcriptional regulator [Bacillota bacterium]HPJ24042.1 PadR family transcriptional regulator [Bacillota bacterium]
MNAQFKKGIIEICVLKIMENEDLCGFDVIEKLSKEIPVNENTIYPLLRRLTLQGYFETYRVPSPVGAPKKYYKITEEGNDKLGEYLAEWKQFIKGVFKILEGDEAR